MAKVYDAPPAKEKKPAWMWLLLVLAAVLIIGWLIMGRTQS